MSEKIKQINKEEIGEYKVPNNGSVSDLKFEFLNEGDYVSPYSMSGEAANRVLSFEEEHKKAFGEKNNRFASELKMVGYLKDSTKRYGESMRKAA